MTLKVFNIYYKLDRNFGISLQASGHYSAVCCVLKCLIIIPDE